MTNTFINIAIAEAEKSDMEIRHGCTLVMNGKVIGRGYNNTRTSISGSGHQCNLPRSFYNPEIPNCSLHAEMMCLLKAKQHFRFKSRKDRFESQCQVVCY